jgi:type VI secretion system protein ImpC
MNIRAIPPKLWLTSITNGHMTMDFSYLPTGDSIRQDDKTLFPIAILADFSGRRHSPESSLSPSRPLRIDCENFGTVFAQFDVTLLSPPIETAGDEPVLRFRQLEDFHPDKLLHQNEYLARLVELRRRLLNPASADAAVAESRELLKMPAAATGPLPSNSTETAEELLTRLLGKPATQPSKVIPGPSAIEHLIKQLVAPSVVPAPNLEQTQMVPLVENALSKRLREVLHCPGFQALEAAWRGVDFLMRGIGDQTKCYLIDITKSELTAMLAGGELARTTVFKQLQEIGPAIVLGIYTFGLEDLSLLKELGSLARATQTALVGGAAPEMAGCTSFGSQPDPDDWVQGKSLDELDALRRMPEAGHLGLLMPRFLLRQPYGAGSDPIEAFPFEEMPSQSEHEFYLWGNSAFLCAYLLADPFAVEESEMDTHRGGEIDGLPVHTYTEAGETHVKPCAEAWLSDKAAGIILHHGIMPVASIRGRDAVEVKALRAFSLPSKPLPFRYG